MSIDNFFNEDDKFIYGKNKSLKLQFPKSSKMI